MPRSWFVRPETKRLDLSDGQWLLIKERLNVGEERAMNARLYFTGDDGQLHVNLLQVGVAIVTAHLLDWSLTDDDGKPIPIRGLSAGDMQQVLDNLLPERYAEIRKAVEAHDDAVRAARTQEKKLPAGESAPAATSPSPSVADGALTGSVN